MKILFDLLRPRKWVKNASVFTGLLLTNPVQCTAEVCFSDIVQGVMKQALSV